MPPKMKMEMDPPPRVEQTAECHEVVTDAGPDMEMFKLLKQFLGSTSCDCFGCEKP